MCGTLMTVLLLAQVLMLGKHSPYSLSFPSLGLHVNIRKCEVFSSGCLAHFPVEIKQSSNPNLEILGIRIGDADFCRAVLDKKRSEARFLLKRPEDVGQVDPQMFDQDIQKCFTSCTGVHPSNVAWNQAQLSLSRGGLGLCSLSHHALAAFISSLCFSGLGSDSHAYLLQAIETFNSSVYPSDIIHFSSILDKFLSQKAFSNMLENDLFNVLMGSLSIRGRLLSASSPHASSWLMVIPYEVKVGLGTLQFIALKWWLGLDTAEGSLCALCPDKMLDPLGHHATTCKHGGDVVFHHIKLRDILAETCRRIHFSVQVEASFDLTSDHSCDEIAWQQLNSSRFTSIELTNTEEI